MNTKTTQLALLSSLTLLGACAGGGEKIDAKGMNVLFVLIDDQGYGDLGCTGSPVGVTPNIDALAAESFRLTNYHTESTSAPTRSGLMTGRYCNSLGAWHTVQGRNMVALDATMIAEVFKANGYRTGQYGKWQLGENYPYRPFDRGFEDTFWNNGYWGNSHYDDVFYRGTEPVQSKGYYTDVYFDAAKEFIANGDERPFFIYLATNAIHAPHNAPDEYVDLFRDKSKSGMVSPVVLGMAKNIDENMGEVEQLLKEKGLYDNTIVIYTSDNGTASGQGIDKASGERNPLYNAGMRGRKGDVWDGGHRLMFFMRIPGYETRACDIDQLAGYIDIPPTLYNICGLEYDAAKADMDGIDLTPVLEDPAARIDRYLTVDTQRKEYISKDNISCVMRESWRLINRQMLYDVSVDVGQDNDIAEQHPEIVAELLSEHDRYWESLEGMNDTYNYIPLTAKGEPAVTLRGYDRHDEQNIQQPYNEMMLRLDRRANADSFHAVDIIEDGVYDFKLYFWPAASGLDIDSAVPATKKPENGKSMPAHPGVKNLTGAELKINGIKRTVDFKSGKGLKYLEIKGVELSKGRANLYTNLITTEQSFAAPSVVVTKR